MVARFAFWADDETTKLNINTHAGGMAWDIPKAGGDMDMDMGRHQPAQKEWQRYPGHPASTHLLTALAPGVLDIVNDRDAMEMLFEVVPRVVGGGSASGTRVINTNDPKVMNGLIPDTEPLFPSLDDVIMRADRTPHQFPDANGDPIPERELADYLERAKFFITVNSRAPETNLFNKPRISMWPIYNAEYNSKEYEEKLTAFDKLIHYCSSIGENKGQNYPRYEYLIKRQKADSPTFDAQIPRNAELHQYLFSLLNQPIPGYGRSFKDKYGTESIAQLATMIFDYIRSTNLHDDTLFNEDFAKAFVTRNTSKHLTFTNPRDGYPNNKGFGNKGHGQVTPLRIDVGNVKTKGMGRFFTLSGADILVACVASHAEDSPDETRDKKYSRYPGVNPWNGRHGQDPSGGPAFSNLPPLPAGVTQQDPNKVNWPQWLKDLELAAQNEIDPRLKTRLQQEFVAAFDPTYWNWQLAFLSPEWVDILKNTGPTEVKFNQVYITLDRCEKMRLQAGQKLVQSTFLFNLFSPSVGWISINPNMQIEIEKASSGGMTFKSALAGGASYGFLGFEGKGTYPGDTPPGRYIWATNWVKPVQESGARAYGGLLPFTYTFTAREQHGETGPNSQAGVGTQLWGVRNPMPLQITSPSVKSRLTPLDRGYDHIKAALTAVSNTREIGGTPEEISQAYRYDLVTEPFLIDKTTGVDFTGGDVKFEIFDGGKHAENSFQDDGNDEEAKSLVQTITLKFPNFRFGFDQITISEGTPGVVNEFEELSSDSTSYLELASLTADPANPWDGPATSASMKGGTWRKSDPAGATWFGSPDPAKKGLNVRGRMADGSLHWHGPYIRPGDIVQSVAIPHGDVRLVAARAEILPEDKLFDKHRYYGARPMAHSLTNSIGQPMVGFSINNESEYLIVHPLGNNPYRARSPLPFARDKSSAVQLYGDFDNGAGLMIDGPYINKPDEGNVHALRTRFTQEVQNYWAARRNYGEFPYFSSPEYAEAGGPAYFSPNRIISGPGMLGSLPTSLFSREPKPWQTLLFRPNVVGNGYSTHPGAESPPDHLIMDLFWMPVVEPYAISEPLSTGGKININSEIVPFFHVRRDTALRGVFRSEYMLCIPNQWHSSYKHDFGRGEGYHWRDRPNGGRLQGKRLRSVIVEEDTMSQIRARFKRGKNAFKSATEICEVHLVPQEYSDRAKIKSGSIGSFTPKAELSTGRVPEMEGGEYWRKHSLVGDNSRERPYTNIQTRLTTKSNTFLVHYRAQVIIQARRENDSEYEEWRPSTDSVQAEYRGSSSVERYVDPNAEMRDFAVTGSASIDEFYRFRVINPRRFAP
jgi:hypothetical protein